ncbi:MAG: glucosaminidase domain-containing protein [Synergistaceae bacterium]|nr:glucosaminidase domain-containing protein [Synergistaceae bacterium]
MRKFLRLLTLSLFAALLTCQSAYAMTVAEFYGLASKCKHIQPFAATVQSACETGHWSSDLWQGAYNGAGLKVSAEWLNAGKPYIVKSSVESRNGNYNQETSRFRKYGSPLEFLNDYEKKIRQDYPRCTRNHDNIWGYFAGLYAGKKGKWATDHRYYEKLTVKAIKLAPEIYGSKWKLKLINDFKAAARRRSLKNWQKDIIHSELKKANVL